eukprot:GEMP01063123.1.p2 GENE.GEMP01063123.1~~GEMP01063123.1.p2  ORF type:complete len:102 (+),score=6.55 GEMP01063123.1:678-983(+)
MGMVHGGIASPISKNKHRPQKKHEDILLALFSRQQLTILHRTLDLHFLFMTVVVGGGGIRMYLSHQNKQQKQKRHVFFVGSPVPSQNGSGGVVKKRNTDDQ